MSKPRLQSFISSKSSVPVALLLVMSISGVQCFGKSNVLSVQVLHHTDDTDASQARIEKGLSTIPTEIQQTISRAGISVVLTPKMTYDEPERSGTTIFREGGTTENIGGLFEPSKMRVIIPERASWRNGAPRPMGDYSTKVLRHELGHAWDFAMGNVSQTGPFLAAYDADFAKLTNEQCRALSYYITGVATTDANVPTVSGHHECFAEVFAGLCTPRADLTKPDKRVAEAFPHVAAYLQTLNSDLEKPPQEEAGSGSGGRSTSSSVAAAAVNTVKVSDSDAARSDSQYAQGMQVFKQKQYEQALGFLSQAVKSNPNNGKAFMLRGTTHMWLKNYAMAVQDYTAYLRLFPKDADGYTLRARAYGYMGKKANQDADEATARGL